MPRCRVVISTDNGGSAEVAPFPSQEATTNNNNVSGNQEQQQQPPKSQKDTAIDQGEIVAEKGEEEETEDSESDEQHNNEGEQQQHHHHHLRPYRPLDVAPIQKHVQDMLTVARAIHARGAAVFEIPQAERRQLDDAVDNLKYVSIAENHFPQHPSALVQAGAIPAAMELLASPRYAVVMAGMSFLSVATRHPLCAREVALTMLTFFAPPSAAASPAGKEKDEKNDDEDDATPTMRGLNTLARVMVKFKNKTELQSAAMSLIHQLVMAKKPPTNDNNNNSNSSSHASSTSAASGAFAISTLDLLRSQLISAVLDCVAARESNPHKNDVSVAANVARTFHLLVAHRPPPILSDNGEEVDENVHQTGETATTGPSVADLFAQVGPILPALLKLGATFPTSSSVVGPVCRVLSDMSVNSHDELANSSAAAAILAKSLRHFSAEANFVPAIVVDCIRGLSQLAQHFLPLQIESLVMQLRGVMTSTGNPHILTTCIVCHLHLLRLAERTLECAEQQHDDEQEKKKKNKTTEQQQPSNQVQSGGLQTSAEEEHITESKKNMRRLLELLQQEAVPYVGAAYDHFADVHADLKTASDMFLSALGERIRKTVSLR